MSECQLWLLRQARAEHHSADGRDISRPLHEAGKTACRHLNRWLRQMDPSDLPEKVLVSPSLRTRETAELVLDGIDLPVHSHERLWLAEAGELLHIAETSLQDLNRLMLIAHNPGLETLTRMLSGAAPAAGFQPGTLIVLGLARPLTRRPARTLQLVEAREST